MSLLIKNVFPSDVETSDFIDVPFLTRPVASVSYVPSALRLT